MARRIGASACDPHWANVSALLHMDNATTWIDETGKTWTPAGGAALSGSHPKFGVRHGEFWSNGKYVSTPSHSDFDFGDGDFTVEAWVRPVTSITSPDQNRGYVCRDNIGGTRGWLMLLRDNANGNTFRFAAFVGDTGYGVGHSLVPSINTWYHLAATREGGTLRFFVNGDLGDSISISGSVNSSGTPCVIGSLWISGATAASAIGSIDEVRITKGIARYTASFTPPSAAFFDAPCQWTPASLSPFVWLNDQSTVTDAGSGRCSQWSDRSGAARHFVQSNSTYRPLIIASGLNGRRTIRFETSGGGNVLANNDSGVREIFTNQSGGWVAAVFRRQTTDGGATSRSLFSVTTNAGAARLVASAAQSTANTPALTARRLDADSAAILNAASTVTTSFRMVLWYMDWSSGVGRVYIDGELSAQNTSLTSSGSSQNNISIRPVMLGGYPAGSGGFELPPQNPSDSEVAELIAGRGVPGGADIDRIFGYLAHRWGLTDNLDAGHPYKSSPP
jgi:hypothetical protein